MRRHKSTTSSNMKKYIKSPEQKESNKYTENNPKENEIYNLNDDDFKTAIIKTLNELRENSDRQLNEFRSYVTKEFDTIKKNQTEILEMKNTIEEIKKNLDALNSRAYNMEERISNLEDGNIELLRAEEEREARLKRSEETLRELSDTIRRCNVRIIGIPEGEEKEKGAESLFKEIMAENFPNLVREMDLQVTEANRSPNFINARRPTPRHIVVKLAKVNDKEKILGTARQKKLTYKGTPIRLSADFSAETLQARREWNDILQNLKDKNLQPRILYPVKISFKYDGEIKTFPDKQKLREFIATKPPLQEILRKTLIPEKSKKGKGLQNQEQRR
uniref:L1 transposable element RRM domain-containing protein n=1 Tax=Equus caballus TaxID=9796 RepID=A0A9L0RFY6_HORSE